ncbi:unnamed protein product, partial [Mesorhabditis belari]|uniref:Uncharacterized protein n=1 Tax=Mesorhabditis belari TaxID=2138241 RepID=A0AAF3FKR7_9BILA
MIYGLWPLLKDGHLDPHYYNCSGHTREEWFAKGRPRPLLAIYLEVTGTVFMLFYVLSLIGMIKAKLILKSPCYVIMVFMGIGDLTMIVMSSWISGYLMWIGAVFCTNQHLIYTTGTLGLGMWSSSCCCCIMLATNRLAEIADWHFVTELLTKKVCTVICALGLCYGMSITLFTPSALFHSPLGAWFFNPYTDNSASLYYDNIPHRANNAIVSIFAIFIYSYMCYKAAKNWGWATGASKAQRMLYIQAFIICSTHVLAAWGYLFMNYVPGFPQSLMVLGHVAWQWSHGVPGVVYLLLNQTIKTTIIEMFGLSKKKTKPYFFGNHESKSEKSNTELTKKTRSSLH